MRRYSYGLGKELRHQFRRLATTPRPHVTPLTPPPFTPRGKRWRSYKTPAPRPVGLAAAKHQQGLEMRAMILAEVRSVSRFPPPVKAKREPVAENVPMPRLRSRGGPMSLYELMCWHRANGTLAAFLASVGM